LGVSAVKVAKALEPDQVCEDLKILLQQLAVFAEP
jgi:hypothetical protein